jgi:hypothetical protein
MTTGVKATRREHVKNTPRGCGGLEGVVGFWKEPLKSLVYINNIFVSSWLCSVILRPFAPPSKCPATFRLCVVRVTDVFCNSHINRTAEIFIMSTYSLYRGDCNYQRMAPPSTIYEANQSGSSNSGNRHLLCCFDANSVANLVAFPLCFNYAEFVIDN